jgi:hypothetical protein
MITLLDYLYGISLPSGVLISELEDCTPKPNIELLTAMCAGDTLPQFIGGHGANPQVDFRTPQIKSILTACGLSFYSGAAGNTDLHYRSGTNLAGRAASGLRIRLLQAAMYWSQLQAKQGEAASISCAIMPTFDGTNAPMTAAGATAVATMSALPQEYYTLGPVSINGAAVAGVEGWTLDMATKPEVKASDGESYPSWCGFDNQTPVLSISTNTLASWATVGVGGLALATGGLVFYLRAKALDSAGCVANAVAQHIKFTAAAGMVFVDQNSGGAGSPAACTLKVALRKAAPTDAHCLTLSTASAIT